MKYEEQIKNKTLTDFKDIKDTVISNSVKDVPVNKKIKGEDKIISSF